MCDVMMMMMMLLGNIECNNINESWILQPSYAKKEKYKYQVGHMNITVIWLTR